MPLRTSYRFCANYCPTGFTNSDFTDCTDGGSVITVFSDDFNDFGGSWTSGTVTATAVNDVMPAKMRGQYFKGVNQYMSFDSFTLWLDFSLYSWIRLDNLSHDHTLFSKERGVALENRIFRAGLRNSDGALFVDMYDSDDWTNIDTAAAT